MGGRTKRKAGYDRRLRKSSGFCGQFCSTGRGNPQTRHRRAGVRRAINLYGQHVLGERLHARNCLCRSDSGVRSREIAMPCCAVLPPSFFSPHKAENVSVLSLTTLVIWSGVAAVGLIGASLQYPRPVARPLPLHPIRAELLQVALTDEPLGQPEDAGRGNASLVATVNLRDVPPLPAVAEPSPAIAFALPIEGPVQTVEPSAATYFRPSGLVATNSVAGSASGLSAGKGSGSKGERFAWGRGEGKQPAPDYPRRAVIEGQEGEVLVRFSVDEDGRVLAAEAVKPSPWPLLNEAAVRAIRERWRFPPGVGHLYDVMVRFELED